MKATRLIEILQSIVDEFGAETPVHLPDGTSYPQVDTARMYLEGGAVYLTYEGDKVWSPKNQGEHRIYSEEPVVQQYWVCGE